MTIIKIRLLKIFFLLCNVRYLFIYLRHNVCISIEHLGILQKLNFQNVVDVGANNGQFSLAVQYLFPQKKIIAFEPLKSCYRKYQCIFKENPRIVIRNYALGSKSEKKLMYITKNNDSSSFLEPEQLKKIYSEHSCKSENHTIKLGDSVMEKNFIKDSLLKIDVQGFELDVLKGLTLNIKSFKYIYVELSHVELYKEQALYDQVSNYLNQNGFIFKEVTNESYYNDQLIQADYLFTRK
ncbi:MAG: hypothetical protein CBC04_00710 [Verrucomicrobia bacterium TMED44]|nr:MAG: hypothetical protein CBC04_00710 [Verrucomicrobia bacterium TMED44]|tara:strand:+ start:2030 stop:2743 length:714 start_codon:yes stop_codon:yes gene_type:complete